MARARWIMVPCFDAFSSREPVSTSLENALSAQPRDNVGRAHVLARAVAAAFHLDFALGKAFRADQNLPGNADQVGARELGAGALVGVVIEDIDALGGQLCVELLAGAVDRGIALLQIQNGCA